MVNVMKKSPGELAEEAWRESLYKSVTDDERAEGVHVSHLKWKCLRKSYYMLKNEGEFLGDYNVLYKIAVGNQLHKVKWPMAEQEVDLTWKGISGRADLIIPLKGKEIAGYDDGHMIVDLKTTDTPPSKNVRHYDENQIQMYGALADVHGYDPKVGIALYVKYYEGKKHRWVSELPVEHGLEVSYDFDFKERRQEMLEDAETILQALEDDSPPPRNTSDECKYCDHFKECTEETEVMIDD